jgi:SAM-dependent methyltransferase
MNPFLSRRGFLLSAASAATAAGVPLLPYRRATAQTAVQPRLDVPYVPTPQDVVDRMLSVARLGKGDVLYDLGCGDGRIVVSAARTYGARGVGFDLNPERIAEAQANARKAGVDRLVSFQLANLFDTDLSPASVVTLYLLPTVNVQLRPRLWQQLAVGSRVVSHAFDMGPEWPPEQTINLGGRTIYRWTITPDLKPVGASGPHTTV